MRLTTCALLLAAACCWLGGGSSAVTSVSAGRLACGVCEALVEEVNASILSSHKTHTVQTRFRVDEKKRTPYARTEHHLLEIMEDDDFPRRFEKFGVVKPWTKTAKHMKRAYALAAEGKEIEPLPREGAKKKEADEAAAPVATEGEAPATPTDDASADAAAAAPAAAESTFDPFRPTGSLPLSLQNNHFHLVSRSLGASTGLNVESSTAWTSEIKSDLDAFLEEYLDEAMLMFHRDVPDLKTKLCVEITEACVPKKKKSKQQQQAKEEPAIKEDL